MSSLPFKTRIHFEMASFTDTELLNDLIEYVVPYADSLGMNEQVRLCDSGWWLKGSEVEFSSESSS